MPLWGTADDKTSTGTVVVNANGLVTGTSTLFDTEGREGDYITTDAETLRIYSITSNTVCHVAPQTLGGVIATASANQYTLHESPIYVTSSEVGANAAQVFGVDTTEVGVVSGTILTATITSPGSGYFANAAITVTGGGGASGAANAEANSTGYISTINITNAGTGYETSPNFAVAAPAAQSFNANTQVAANGFVTIASNVFQLNDLITYGVAAGNTALAELTATNQYYIQAANSTGVYLSEAADGTAITLTASDTSETGHTFTGETATVITLVGGAQGVQHAGWNRRTVGTGNFAGRVKYETLVAMDSITGDSGDDQELPDS
jgi:hypothetical protein